MLCVQKVQGLNVWMLPFKGILDSGPYEHPLLLTSD